MLASALVSGGPHLPDQIRYRAALGRNGRYLRLSVYGWSPAHPDASFRRVWRR
ncbi:MAG: hypothetical protein IPM76_16510 [Chloroflexi bacterium]|nr:hypothetical protein [Chloroflexota bacterium]